MEQSMRFMSICLATCTYLACGEKSHDAVGGSIQLTASGEALAFSGYEFPPSDVGFVDGWEVKFDRLLLTVDHITLSDNPDKSEVDQSTTDGIVAQVDGPWAFDLHPHGALPGKGGGDETAVPFATLDRQNR